MVVPAEYPSSGPFGMKWGKYTVQLFVMDDGIVVSRASFLVTIAISAPGELLGAFAGGGVGGALGGAIEGAVSGGFEGVAEGVGEGLKRSQKRGLELARMAENLSISDELASQLPRTRIIRAQTIDRCILTGSLKIILKKREARFGWGHPQYLFPLSDRNDMSLFSCKHDALYSSLCRLLGRERVSRKARPLPG